MYIDFILYIAPFEYIEGRYYLIRNLFINFGRVYYLFSDICYALRGDRWYCFDDKTVRPINADAVQVRKKRKICHIEFISPILSKTFLFKNKTTAVQGI